MSRFAGVIRDEVIRLARKEVKAQTEVLRRNSAQHRTDIAQLKKQVLGLQRKVALLEKKTWAEPAATRDSDVDTGTIRFSAKGLASHREKLGLSAADYAKLVGVSSLSIYKWEKGNTRPRDAQIIRLAAVRGMGKREAIARLEQM